MSGYTKLAKFSVGRHYPILRKYKYLAVRDLLYLQAEIRQLEHQFDEVSRENSRQSDDRRRYDKDWLHLESSEEQGFGEQRDLALAIRSKLREYYDAISQYSDVAAMRQPKEIERSYLQKWISSPSMGGGCDFTGLDLAVETSVYDQRYVNDLAILTDSHGENDLFTQFVTGPLVTIYHYLRSPSKTSIAMNEEEPVSEKNQTRLYHYEDRHVDKVITILGTILSSSVPLISIIVLFFVVNPKLRLGLVCAFTVLFSSCLAGATNARRIEIFAATAAFASVQVVFIGASPPIK